ncbi:DUF1722 domain-containing protein [Escherichia coli]|nr:DUF1722 domain-containing protein [Escherichia coli]
MTGEGRIDSQTAGGKAPLGVASVAKQFNVPVIGIAGVLGDGDYHSRYKLVFLAHSQPEYRKLGPFVADIHQWQNLDDYYNQYRQRVVVLLSHPANPRDHTNVLMHVQGYFRPHIDSTERQQLAALIDSYRRGEQPLLAPLMRIKHYMALYPDAWLSGQRYFELWPRVINLRHSGVL